MRKKSMKRVSALKLLAQLASEAEGGNVDELIKHWKTKEHPFSECKSWVSKHKGAKDYPDIKDSDAFCGKLKHLVED